MRISVISADESQITNYGWAIYRAHHQTTVRFVRGWKCRTLDRLFGEFGAALQFPYYFGENYPAFAECLSDLSWMPKDKLVLIIVRVNEMLADEPIEMGAFWRSVAAAMDSFVGQVSDKNLHLSRERKSFEIVVQCAPVAFEQTIQILTGMQIDVERKTLTL
jgi:barstar (barnase inhibitor)